LAVAALGSSDSRVKRRHGETVNTLLMEHCPVCGGELKIIAAILE